MLANLGKSLVLWSSSHRQAFILELTVQREDAIDEAHQRKKLWGWL